MNKLLTLLTAAIGAVTAFADGESLAETGGYVPVDAPALAFKNITLADLGKNWFPSVRKHGGWAGGDAEVPLFCRTEEAGGGVSYQAQWIDGSYLKSVTVKFTDGAGGVYAQLTSAKATNATY